MVVSEALVKGEMVTMTVMAPGDFPNKFHWSQMSQCFASFRGAIPHRCGAGNRIVWSRFDATYMKLDGTPKLVNLDKLTNARLDRVGFAHKEMDGRETDELLS
jgi:hypothetical protein